MSFALILPFLRPIEHLIRNDAISEIMVNGSGRIFIENTLERVRAVSPIAVRGDLDEAARVASEQHLFDFARSERPHAVCLPRVGG